MSDSRSSDTLLKFPCDFTIKVFGLANEEFESTVYMLIHQHVPNLSDRAIQARKSDNGKYCALSINIHVHSKQQLDDIYRDLSSSSCVLMAL